MPRQQRKPADDNSPTVSEKSERQPDDEPTFTSRFDPRDLGMISHDELGNAVWRWRLDIPNRHDEDPTIDFIECLEVDGLTVDDKPDEEPEPGDEHFDPYDRTR